MSNKQLLSLLIGVVAILYLIIKPPVLNWQGSLDKLTFYGSISLIIAIVAIAYIYLRKRA